MRFFIPGASDKIQGEESFQNLRARVEAEVGPIADRRIYSIRFDQDGALKMVSVGSSGADLPPVLAVFQGRGDYYVCRGTPGVLTERVERIDGRSVVMVQDFTALA
jgi:hypothetical protein